MRLHRLVPITPAMMAVGDAMDTDDQAVINDSVFKDWWHDPTVGTGHDYVLNRVSVSTDEARDLIDTCPDTPAGGVWKAAVEASLALTLADDYRPFDQGVWEEHEQIAIKALDALAEEMRETSPLLEDVADVVQDQAPAGVFGLGDVLAPRNSITMTGIVLGRAYYCDKHDGTCHAETRPLAKWEHLEAMVPGMQTRLRELLIPLDASLPALAEDDNAAARYGRAYR